MNNDLEEIKNIIEKKLQTNVDDIIQITGGLVHYIYQITSAKGIFFVKIRKSYFSALPHIPTKAEYIQYEKKAIEIVSKIEPLLFPKLLAFIPNRNLLILSDIMPDRTTLEMKLNIKTTTEMEMYNLGKTLATIHKKLSQIKKKIRKDRDADFYNHLLFYRFGYHLHPALNELIVKLEKLPRQLVLGDLSPKNIGVSSNGSFTFCDLENFHNGNKISDLGFLGGNILIHTINDYSLAKNLLLSLLKGYSSIDKLEIEDLTLMKIVLGICLYRLENSVIPYEIPISQEKRTSKSNSIKKILNRNNISWDEVINSIIDNN